MATKNLDMEPGFDPARLEKLKRRAEYQEVVFDGAVWPFLVNGFGLKRAEKATGVDAFAMLYDVMLMQSRGMLKLAAMEKKAQALSEDFEAAGVEGTDRIIEQVALAMQAAGFTKNMMAYGAYFYAGVVSFYEALTFDEVLLRLTDRTMAELEPVVADKIAELMRGQEHARANGQAEPVTADDGAEGN